MNIKNLALYFSLTVATSGCATLSQQSEEMPVDSTPPPTGVVNVYDAVDYFCGELQINASKAESDERFKCTVDVLRFEFTGP